MSKHQIGCASACCGIGPRTVRTTKKRNPADAPDSRTGFLKRWHDKCGRAAKQIAESVTVPDMDAGLVEAFAFNALVDATALVVSAVCTALDRAFSRACGGIVTHLLGMDGARRKGGVE